LQNVTAYGAEARGEWREREKALQGGRKARETKKNLGNWGIRGRILGKTQKKGGIAYRETQKR